MEYNDIKESLGSHPTLLIFRDRQAALILGFLGQVFGENRMAVLPREDLQLNLALYLEELEWPSEDDNSDYTLLSGDFLDSCVMRRSGICGATPTTMVSLFMS